MINNSLLLRTAGNHPLIQVHERSAWVRDFPDVPRSCLDTSVIPDWWKAGNLSASGREIATGAGRKCPLSGVKRTSGRDVAVSAVDPKLTRALRGLRAGGPFCLGPRGPNLLFAH